MGMITCDKPHASTQKDTTPSPSSDSGYINHISSACVRGRASALYMIFRLSPATQRCFQPARLPSGQLRSQVSVKSQPEVAAVCSTVSVSSGELTIQPLGIADVQGAALLLTRAFAGTAEAVKFDEALKYMEERLQRATAGSGLTLVARLVPTDAALLPPGKDSRLVGTVSLSFTAASRETFSSLAPPADEAYLANMAVDPKFRRQGIARAMLGACDTAVLQRGQSCVWLHVRLADDAAQRLYAGYAYSEQDRDKPQGGLFGFGTAGGIVRPRILMRRQLAADNSS